MIARALERTAALWPDVEYAYRFVHAVAHWLGNPHEESAAMVRRRVNGVLGAMQRHRGKAGTLAGAFDHFQKVTRSYRPGLFHTYAVPGPAAHQQRSRTALRLPALSRAARDRAQDGRPRGGSARLGSAARRHRHPRAGSDGRATWEQRTGSTGGACASAWREAAAREPCAPAFGMIPPPTWRLSNSRPAS